MGNAKGESLCVLDYDDAVFDRKSYRTGAKGNAKPKPCVKCDGKGWTPVHTQVSALRGDVTGLLRHAYVAACAWSCGHNPGTMFGLRRTWREAQGKGLVCIRVQFALFPFMTRYRCKKCKGKKTVKEKNRQEIFVERGMPDRNRIVLTGAGDEEVCSFLSVSMAH